MQINKLIECLRVGGVVFGITLAYRPSADPATAFSLLAVTAIVSIAGLTALEALFFGSGAARLSGYRDAGPYQRQSGLNNLALALAAVWVWWRGWGLHAEAALFLVLLTFLTLSGLNHTFSAGRDGSLQLRSFSRPMATAMLLATVVPVMLRAFNAQP